MADKNIQEEPLDDVDGIVKTEAQEELEVRIINTGSLSGLYCMMICSSGLTLTFALALTNKPPNPLGGTSLFLFHMYVYITGFMFLVLLEVSIIRFKRQQHHELNQKKPSIRVKKALEDQSSILENQDDYDTSRISHEEIRARSPTVGLERCRRQDSQLSFKESMKKLESFPAFQFTGEGVNLFARLGLVAFGSCAVILDGCGLFLVLDPEKSVKFAHPVMTSLSMMARMLFTLLQTFSLFKNHKLLINHQHMVVKFGLLHVAAANICTWILALVLEADRSLKEEHAVTQHEANLSNQTNNNTMTDSFFYVASPYLFPFVIEFTLLAAALSWKLYSSVGMTTIHSPRNEIREDKATHQWIANHCNAANTSLFIGLGMGMVILIGSIVSLGFFLYCTSMDYKTTRIYLITDIIVNSVSLIATIPAFYYFHKMCFTGVVETALDQHLLLIALGGFYILFGFISFASASHVSDLDMNSSHAKLQLVTSVITSVQATLQTVFIIDAQYRKATSPEQMAAKPGRCVVTFLLICNLAMWLINVFQLKEIQNAGIFSDTFGMLPWKLILNIFLPLAVFYRFHASVCLSDIWEKTYSEEEHHNVHILSLVNSADSKQC